MDKIYQWSGDRECWLEAPPGYGPCEPPQGDMVLVERHDSSDVCQETILDYRPKGVREPACQGSGVQFDSDCARIVYSP